MGFFTELAHLIALLLNEILKPENYFNENYNNEVERTIHKCYSGWTQYHFVAANNEIASFIYLLKDRLFGIEITEAVDSIISYKVERNRIKHCIEYEKRFISHILTERRTNEDFSNNNYITLYKLYKLYKLILYYFNGIFTQEDEMEGHSAIELSKINHGDNNIFITFIDTVIGNLEKLFETS